jgi:hypothetical protein
MLIPSAVKRDAADDYTPAGTSNTTAFPIGAAPAAVVRAAAASLLVNRPLLHRQCLLPARVLRGGAHRESRRNGILHALVGLPDLRRCRGIRFVQVAAGSADPSVSFQFSLLPKEAL